MLRLPESVWIRLMKVFILTLGTRGDLETFLILGRELRRRGHRVLIGTSSFYSERIAASRLEWLQIGNGTAEQMQAVLRSMAVLDHPKRRTETFIQQWVAPQLRQSIRTIQLYAVNADYFISNLKMHVPRNTEVVPGAFVTYDVPESLQDLAKHGSQRHGGRIIDLVAMSKPLIDRSNAWDVSYQFTGFWLDDQPLTWIPSEPLLRFLSEGSPPVVFTLGSMATLEVSGLPDTVIETLRVAGGRGVILGNLAGEKRGFAFGNTIYFEGEIPYQWLFPKACAVVHHGGVGTVAAALRAGVPSVLLPQISAQQYLARVLLDAGLATGVFETRALDAKKLGASIRLAVTETKYQETAKAWQAEIVRDCGVRSAADLIEEHWKQLR